MARPTFAAKASRQIHDNPTLGLNNLYSTEPFLILGGVTDRGQENHNTERRKKFTLLENVVGFAA